jgi:hypothetical protein
LETSEVWNKTPNIKGVLEMPENQLPPKIHELLKKKGWSWPLDEKTKAQIHEAMERLSGSIHIPEEDLEELFGDNPRFSYILKANKLR